MSYLKYSIFILLLFILSCGLSKKDNRTSPNTNQIEQNKYIIQEQGLKELEQVNEIAESSSYFSIDKATKIILYELSGHGNHSGAESVFRQRTGIAKEIKVGEAKEFIDLINTKSSYGVSYAACHEPKLGMVCYHNDEPTAYFSLCLACNNIYTKPRIDLGLEGARDGGFNKESRNTIREIIERWGFRDESINIFDSESSIRKILKRKGLTNEEIEKELLEIGN